MNLLKIFCLSSMASAIVGQLSCDPNFTFSCDEGTCIPNTRLCDSRRDCPDGEDELDCGDLPPCSPRSNDQARYNGYRCAKSCRTTQNCATNEVCVCDDECGRSCLKRITRCARPPVVKSTVGHTIVRFRRGRRKVVRTNNYQVGDMVKYQCAKGLNLTGPLPRCSSAGQWSTGRPQCVDFSKCGQAGRVRLQKLDIQIQKIIDGKDASETAWPWYALISERQRTAKWTFHACFMLGGGSLINKKWVLTASHVFSKFTQPNRFTSKWHKQIVVSLGVIRLPSGNEIPRTLRSYVPQEIAIHPSFDELTFENDIALIKLGNRIDYSTMAEIPNTDGGAEFGYYIRPVCLPCSKSCFDGDNRRTASGRPVFRAGISLKQKCRVEELFLFRTQRKVVVTGYGHTKPVRSVRRGCITPSKRLQQGQLRVLPRQSCRNHMADFNRNRTVANRMVFNDNFLCCVGKDSNSTVDACQGDSGGPVVRKVSNQRGRACWIQIGIVSWGIGCGSRLPAYYTNVPHYAQWIKNVKTASRNAAAASSPKKTGQRTG